MNKTDEILQVLRDELRAGRYKKGGRFPSEYALMKRFGVSRPTINKVTSQLEADGFIARGVRGSGTTVLEPAPFPAGHIAYIGPIAHLYSSRVLDGLQRAAFFQNYAVSFFCPNENLLDYLDKIAHSRFDGVLASTIGKIPSSFPLPVVYLDDAFPVEAPIRSSVSCSNYLGAEKMAKLAISRGHREIVICTEASSSVSRLERVKGFSDVLQKADIPHVNEKIFTVQSRVTASCIRTLKNIIRKFPDTTLLLTDSDDIAIAMFHTMQTLMPEKNICITGFGNVLNKYNYIMPIPTVEQHPEEIGIQGVSELIRCIKNKNYNAEKVIEIETELVNTEFMPHIKH